MQNLCTGNSSPPRGLKMTEMEQPKAVQAGMSASELAHALGVSMGTVALYTDLGELRPHCTTAGQRRFTDSDANTLAGALRAGRAYAPAPTAA